MARTTQNQEDQPFAVVAFGSGPEALQYCEFVLFECDAAPLGRGVSGERCDDHEGAAGAQTVSQRLQGAVTGGEERGDESQGDQVVCIGQRCPIVAFDVEVKPPSRSSVSGAGLCEGGLGPVNGIHGVADVGQVSCEVTDPAPDIEGSA